MHFGAPGGGKQISITKNGKEELSDSRSVVDPVNDYLERCVHDLALQRPGGARGPSCCQAEQEERRRLHHAEVSHKGGGRDMKEAFGVIYLKLLREKLDCRSFVSCSFQGNVPLQSARGAR